MTDQTEPEDTCRPVEIDGETIRVQGSGEMSEEAHAALTEVVRAAKAKFIADAPDQVGVLQNRLRLAHQARRAKEHQLDGIRRALCDVGAMHDDDPYSHADLEDVIRGAWPGAVGAAEATVKRERDLADAMRGSADTRWLADQLDSTLNAEPEPSLPNHTVNEEEAPTPVKQRADCTELEWAEQERARFERLYTRETVRADLAEQRADTAARDADIYQKRLERLSDGYTEQRKRAEAMERAMESTAADALKHRGCHRELMAQCLRAERAEAAITRVGGLAAELGRAGWSQAAIGRRIREALDEPAPGPAATQAPRPRACLIARDGGFPCITTDPCATCDPKEQP